MKYFILLICIGAVVAVDWDVWTPLDEYVQSDDGFFSWTELDSIRYDGVTLYLVNMTSQKWMDETFSNRPIWWHLMGIAIPDNLLYLDAAVMYIGMDDNEMTELPGTDDIQNVLAAKFANDSGTIAAYLEQMPNQPTIFYNDPNLRRRSEDAAIAWTWRTFADEPERGQQVIMRMPMTRAAKRGLDTINEFAKEKIPESNVTRFGVTGASKRGWTTFSLAATDQRVVLMAPMVFSMINMNVTVLQHNRNMDGGWSFAFEPYYRENLTLEFYNPRTVDLFEVEDMYYYRERFTLPKLHVLSSGDEFFLCDDSLNWWNGMPGPKYMLMLQNAEHIMAPHYGRIYNTILSFWEMFMKGIPYPSVSWELGYTETGGTITFHTDPAPARINGYRAVTLGNDTRRDFRLAAGTPGEVELHPVIWREELKITDVGNGTYYVEVDNEEVEWVGFFLEGVWPGTQDNTMSFTSQVNVIPNTFPRPACASNEECYGYLT